MIYREHLLEIYVDGEKLELQDQRSINLRLNNVLIDPTRITSTSADYSFSFDIPSTPRNDRIFDYADNLAKTNKFHPRWNAEVYADGHMIFQGSLTINSFKDNKYNVNLVQVKTYSLDDIFGDAKLTDIPWYVPYDGIESVNEYNDMVQDEVTFPLISYGAFQKSPIYTDEVGNTYTSKFDLDKYNRWWYESFYPSLNMMTTIRKAFEWKGYSVGGDAYTDRNLTDIYMSCNLSEGQIPLYNLANPRIGSVNLSATYTTTGSGYEQELDYPYFYVNNARGHFGGSSGVADRTLSAWNWDSIRIYDLMKNGSTTMADTYMYDPNEKCIVIPADGFYKIELEVTSTLNTTGNLSFSQNVITQNGAGNDITGQTVSMPASFLEVSPIEIQLVKNYDDNCELIKGKNNKEYVNGNPTQTTNYNGRSNVSSWLTCFPHEDSYNAELPTDKNGMAVSKQSSFIGSTSSNSSTSSSSSSTGGATAGGTSEGGHFGGRRARGKAPSTSRDYNKNNYGYIYKNGEIMAYDQAVSDNFICGFSSFLGGTPAVMKNGYSWSKTSSIENHSFFKNTGYNNLYYDPATSTYRESASTLNENDYPNAPAVQFSCSSNRMYGKICCMVYLYRNDVLELFAIQRAYQDSNGNDVNYSTTNNVTLKISAASPNSYAFLKSRNYGYNSESEFDYDLKLTNFMNNETTVSSFIQDLANAFNLQIIQDGKQIWVNQKKNPMQYNGYAVDIDDRVNSFNAESSIINYPKSMAVKYKIDEDEWGFERSVEPQSMLNQPDWKDYADYGYTEIELNDDSYVTNTSDISLPFSYTWYDNFTWFDVDEYDNQTGNPVTLRMPVISNFTYMIDGYDYDECMKHDGYGLPLRFWFRPQPTGTFVWADSKPSERIDIYLPANYNGNINLSYKANENSLLTYFNTRAYLASNYVEIDVYLSPEEYNDLKNGAMCRFDKDLYYVCEIEAYDCTCYNPATLKLIKKVV